MAKVSCKSNFNMWATTLRQAAAEVHCVHLGVPFSLGYDRALGNKSSPKVPQTLEENTLANGTSFLQDIIGRVQISCKEFLTWLAKGFA